jgi:hypothetical protein
MWEGKKIPAITTRRTIMPKRGKKYREKFALLDKTAQYDVAEAMDLVQKNFLCKV